MVRIRHSYATPHRLKLPPARALAPDLEEAKSLDLEEVSTEAKSPSGWSGILGALATATNITSSLKNQRLLAISH
jgi:hypothetical protein